MKNTSPAAAKRAAAKALAVKKAAAKAAAARRKATPTPEQIIEARSVVGLTQPQAAECCHLGAFQRWSEYERGVAVIPLATWELFLLKTGQTELVPYEPADRPQA